MGQRLTQFAVPLSVAVIVAWVGLLSPVRAQNQKKIITLKCTPIENPGPGQMAPRDLKQSVKLIIDLERGSVSLDIGPPTFVWYVSPLTAIRDDAYIWGGYEESPLATNNNFKGSIDRDTLDVYFLYRMRFTQGKWTHDSYQGTCKRLPDPI